jgi:hypothetical protein
MGAPPGWGPNWKKNKEREQYADSQREAEKAHREDEKEKRDLDIFRNGDLVKNTMHEETGVIIEAGYRSYVEVLTNGVPRKWRRVHVDVICERGER